LNVELNVEAMRIEHTKDAMNENILTAVLTAGVLFKIMTQYALDFGLFVTQYQRLNL
jgi:hypothetical protein